MDLNNFWTVLALFAASLFILCSASLVTFWLLLHILVRATKKKGR